jgi:hypothetical protein
MEPIMRQDASHVLGGPAAGSHCELGMPPPHVDFH